MAYMDGITCICDNGRTLEDHRPIVGDDVISGIYRKAVALQGKRVLHVNSTYQSGGVAEMILSLVPLMNDVGIKTQWNILTGEGGFFAITKNFHNALQGQPIAFSDEEKGLYLKTNQSFSGQMAIDHDLVVIHDPQPLPLIRFYPKAQPWVWRCHVDLSNPDPALWEFLKGFVLDYDRMVISHDQYRRAGMPMEQWICRPAIDPLSEKNIPLERDEIEKTYNDLGIPMDKPIVLQVSRFDKFKDPLGVIESYRIIKEHMDIRLVMAGGEADDDPEALEILREVEDAAKGDPDISILMLPSDSHRTINALQSGADVVMQKSIREGFGLTVTEAMWKNKAVIGGNVGGIRLQVINRFNGFRVRTPEGAAIRTRYLLSHPWKRERMGKNAREYVLENFLITGHLKRYITMLISLDLKEGPWERWF